MKEKKEKLKELFFKDKNCKSLNGRLGKKYIDWLEDQLIKLNPEGFDYTPVGFNQFNSLDKSIYEFNFFSVYVLNILASVKVKTIEDLINSDINSYRNHSKKSIKEIDAFVKLYDISFINKYSLQKFTNTVDS